MFFPSEVKQFFRHSFFNHNSKWKTVLGGVSDDDNPQMCGISLESRAAFCRWKNWKCVKLKCPEIKVFAFTQMSCNKTKAEESGSLWFARQLGQLNWGCIRRPLGKNWTNHAEFCPGLRGSFILSVRFTGSFYQVGNWLETGRVNIRAINNYCWRERLYWCFMECFFFLLTQQMPFVLIGFVRNGHVSHPFLLKSVYVPRVWIT